MNPKQKFYSPFILNHHYVLSGMNQKEKNEENWTKTYLGVFLLGIFYVILFALFTFTFNLP